MLSLNPSATAMTEPVAATAATEEEIARAVDVYTEGLAFEHMHDLCAQHPALRKYQSARHAHVSSHHAADRLEAADARGEMVDRDLYLSRVLDERRHRVAMDVWLDTLSEPDGLAIYNAGRFTHIATANPDTAAAIVAAFAAMDVPTKPARRVPVTDIRLTFMARAPPHRRTIVRNCIVLAHMRERGLRCSFDPSPSAAAAAEGGGSGPAPSAATAAEGCIGGSAPSPQ